MTSILIGTLGLSIAIVAALVLANARAEIATARVNRIRCTAGVALFLQMDHFIEESSGRFYERFPEVLGLAPWPREFFVTSNFIWLAVSLVSIMALRRFRRVGAIPLWFLAIACTANGIVHPILSFDVSGYFPGLWTSPLVGIFGIALFKSLMSATHAQHDCISPHDSI